MSSAPETTAGPDRPAASPADVVVLRGVGLTYPGPQPVTALRPSDLTIRAGEYVAVVGPSGSGKSSLLNVVGLLDRPTTGSYVLAGHATETLDDTTRTALRSVLVGFVFQAFHLLPYRTAEENVALALLYKGIRAPARRRAARETLDRLGLGHRLRSLPVTMSGGERQRVAVARALVSGPELLLCDEPTGNLDSASSENVLALLDEVCTAGQTVVVVTHDPTVAARAGRWVSVRDGVLAEIGAPP